MATSKFKKTTDLKKEQDLKYLLHKNLCVSDPPRSLQVLHASELTYEDTEFCPRERSFLLRDGDNRKAGRLGTSLHITYQIGRWYENQIRNHWLRGYVLGNWECRDCNYMHEYQTVPETCDGCGISGDLCTYIEPRAYSPEYDTSCGIDFLLWKDETLTACEVKTIDKDYFRDLNAPMSEHRRRTQFYLDLLSHSTWMDYDVDINLEYAHLLYVCKGFGFADDYKGRHGVPDAKFSPFKEFKVKRSDGKGLSKVYQKALDVKNFKADGIIPKREICPTSICKRAQKCSMRERCFA